MNNPQAFPGMETDCTNTKKVKLGETGPIFPPPIIEHKEMNLLDYFAGRAITGLAYESYDLDVIAKEAYILSKAMLKEREKYQ